MSNVFDFSKAREIKKSKNSGPIKREIEFYLLNAVSRSLFKKCGARATLDNFLTDIGNLSDEKLKEDMATRLAGEYSHLMRHYTESLQQMLDYLYVGKFHLLTGRTDIIIEPGLEYQENDPYPSPMLIFGFGADPFDNGEVYSSASISAKSIWFDGDFQDIDRPALMNSPLTIPDEDGITHINICPDIRWKSGVDLYKRGMYSPYILTSLFREFLGNGIACNSGLRYRVGDDRHYFSYLQMIGSSTVTEWLLTIHDSVYDLQGLGDNS